MLTTEKNKEDLQRELEELRIQLDEARTMIEAIKEGAIDALVVQKEGQPAIYSLESADYTYRVLIEKISEGALSVSENGLILFCNDYFARLVGTLPEMIVGTYFYSLIDSVGEFHSLQKELKKGSVKGDIVLNAAGRKIPVHISIADLNPLVPAMGIIVTDLSQKRKHEQDLASYQKRLEIKINELNETNAHLAQFVHVISHDIKTPLRKIVAYSGRLQDTKSELLSPADLNHLKVIRKAALRLDSLVEDLTRYSLNTVKPELAEVDLNLIVNEVIEDLEMAVTESKVMFKLNELPKIEASDFQMRQLFLNLFNNSIKFRKADTVPTITVTAEVVDCIDMLSPNKKFHKITVRDNGIGIDNAYLNKIFTIFQRLHTKEEYEGNGVGLAICKKIMTNHQGSIEALSPYGEGSIFNLYFPVKK